MVGPLEIVILLVIILLVTGLYRKLPALGRSAGTQARVGGEKARDLADRTAPKARELADKASAKGSEVGAKVADRIDPAEIGRKAGAGVREARDMKTSVKGLLDEPPKRSPDEPAAGPEPGAEAPDADSRPDADPS